MFVSVRDLLRARTLLPFLWYARVLNAVASLCLCASASLCTSARLCAFVSAPVFSYVYDKTFASMPYSAFLRLVVRSFFSGLFFVLVSGCSDTDVDSPAPAPVFSVAEQTLYRVTSSEQILSIVLVSDAAHTVEVTEGTIGFFQRI